MTLPIRDLEIISSQRCVLGEGIQIDTSGEVISWVDIKSDLCFVKVKNIEKPIQCVGLTAPSRILGIGDLKVKVLHQFGISEIEFLNGRISNLLTFSPHQKNLRSNDGEEFPDGSIWYSRMGLAEEQGMGSIWRWMPDSSENRMVDGLTIPNTILKLPHSDEIYFADSASGSLFVGEISSFPSELRNIRKFGDLDNSYGVPDGSCLDSAGNLWNCRWGAGKIVILSPSGELIDWIELPMNYPTSCKLDSKEEFLFVTSANPENKKDPYSGHTLKLAVA